MSHPLRKFREANKLSLDALAAVTGISKPSLSRIETGKQKTTQATIERLMKATGLSANDFIASQVRKSLPARMTT